MGFLNLVKYTNLVFNLGEILVSVCLNLLLNLDSVTFADINLIYLMAIIQTDKKRTGG